jgi:integrase
MSGPVRAVLERSEGLRFHDLRHTAATRMAEAGAHTADIKGGLRPLLDYDDGPLPF